MIALKADKVTKRFSTMSRPALDNVSFELEQGRCLGIVGGSGSGKSTLAKIIMLLEKADEGDVSLFGKTIGGSGLSHARSVYSQMQMVFQNPVDSFNPRRTLGYSIAEPGRSFGLTKQEALEKAHEKLRAAGLDESFFDRRPSEVSGGQCQRAAVARALMAEPSVLICDEITSALDVTTQARIVELIEELKKSMTIVFITHDLALVSNLSDQIIVMQEGRIVERGDTSEVISNPRTEYTRQLLSSVYTLNG